MSEKNPSFIQPEDNDLARLQARLDSALTTGGQPAVDAIWREIDSRPLAQEDSTAFDIVNTAEDITTASVDAATAVSRGLAQLFLDLGPPPAEILEQHQPWQDPLQ